MYIYIYIYIYISIYIYIYIYDLCGIHGMYTHNFPHTSTYIFEVYRFDKIYNKYYIIFS